MKVGYNKLREARYNACIWGILFGVIIGFGLATFFVMVVGVCP
jgi:hypothetical protein